mgnify:CR=1 FL=1
MLKKFVIISVIIIIVAAAMFVPYKQSTYDDGTRCYTSLTYQVVYWHRAHNNGADSVHVATDFYLFPFNFRDNVDGKVWDEASGSFIYRRGPLPLEEILK